MAVEQKLLESQKGLGPVANKNNAFNLKRKEYMKKAEKSLSENLQNWKDLLN